MTRVVANLVLTGIFTVDTKKKKVVVGGYEVFLTDIPFIRYRFKRFDEGCDEYILSMCGKFKTATPLLEVTLYEKCYEDIARLSSKIPNLAVMLYIPIEDSDVEKSDISEESKALLQEVVDSGVAYDRIMIKDNSNTLFTVSFNSMRASIQRITGCEVGKVGVCKSPLSAYNNNACIPAIVAREILINHDSKSNTTPTARMECRNGGKCCCIRNIVIDRDILLNRPYVEKPSGESLFTGMPKPSSVKRERRERKVKQHLLGNLVDGKLKW